MTNAPASPVPVCECHVRKPDGDAVKYHVTEFPCRIGRNADCDLVIDEPSVSGLHMVLALLPDGRLQLEDQWSTNGIYLKRRRVTQVAVDRTMELTLGKVKVTLVVPGPAAEASADDTEAGIPASTSEDAECLFRRKGREYGPYTPAELSEMARSGTLRPSDLVWVPGATAWLRAEFMPSLFGDDGRTPKPSAAATSRREPASRAKSRAAAKKAEDQIEFTRSPTRRGIVCPHCWHRFDVEEFLFIARHQSLVGDPVLGADAQQRFLPSRFTPEGNAIDSAGTSCPDMACPRCHLRIPQPASEMPPLFLSSPGQLSTPARDFARAAWKRTGNSTLLP